MNPYPDPGKGQRVLTLKGFGNRIYSNVTVGTHPDPGKIVLANVIVQTGVRNLKRFPAAAVLAAMIAIIASLPASAAGERTLSLYGTNTRESLKVTYFRNGSYDKAAMKKLNWFLRDWRRKEPANIDPLLLDLVHEVYVRSGATGPIHVHSAYRSKATNNALRKRSSGVARNSQHIQGKAMDFRIPGVKVSKLREIAMKMQVGGVGYYPRSNSPFVHLDVSRVRSWPRMSSKQLAKLFPDGKTVHLPSNGKPLKGYKVAQAELAKTPKAQRIGTTPTQVAKRSLFAKLFSGSSDKKDSDVQVVADARKPAVARSKSSPGASTFDLAGVMPRPKPDRVVISAPQVPVAAPVVAAAYAGEKKTERKDDPFGALLASDREAFLSHLGGPLSSSLEPYSYGYEIEIISVVPYAGTVSAELTSRVMNVGGVMDMKPELTEMAFRSVRGQDWGSVLVARPGASSIEIAKARLRKKLSLREFGFQAWSPDNWYPVQVIEAP